MHAHIEQERVALFCPITSKTLMFSHSLEGRKIWRKDGALTFEATPLNLANLKRFFPELPIPRNGAGTVVQPPSWLPGDPLPSPAPKAVSELPRPSYVMRANPLPFRHQAHLLDRIRTPKPFGLNNVFAIYMETGTGKTKPMIDHAGELWAAGQIDCVLVVTKKGPHLQWVEEQLPLHIGSVAWRAVAWPETFRDRQNDKLDFFTINFRAIIFPKGEKACLDFISGRRCLIIVDESHEIKSDTASQTKQAIRLRRLCSHALISSGTPLTKNIMDKWSQFLFLDERILGFRYKTTFRNRYCVIDEHRQVVDHQNLDDFMKRVDPWVFRVTKDEVLDLPPKQYATHVFQMSDEQKRYYQEMKNTFMAELDDGEVVSVPVAIASFVKLQQIISGYIITNEQDVVPLKENPRLEALKDVLETIDGQAIIWARFKYDIDSIAQTLGKKCVIYDGRTSQLERNRSLECFLSGQVPYFVANQASGGVGLNLQVGGCRHAIYYSNTFNAVDRWQSEDRIHRIGTVGHVIITDLICHRSIDRSILANLRKKKSLSELVLGDMRRILEGLEL